MQKCMRMITVSLLSVQYWQKHCISYLGFNYWNLKHASQFQWADRTELQRSRCTSGCHGSGHVDVALRDRIASRTWSPDPICQTTCTQTGKSCATLPSSDIDLIYSHNLWWATILTPEFMNHLILILGPASKHGEQPPDGTTNRYSHPVSRTFVRW